MIHPVVVLAESLSLVPVQHGAVDAPWAAAGEDEVEKHEAVENSQSAAIDRGVEGLRRVRDEIGEGHFTGHNERAA